jgi:hypothetical protein
VRWCVQLNVIYPWVGTRLWLKRDDEDRSVGLGFDDWRLGAKHACGAELCDKVCQLGSFKVSVTISLQSHKKLSQIIREEVGRGHAPSQVDTGQDWSELL